MVTMDDEQLMRVSHNYGHMQSIAAGQLSDSGDLQGKILK